MSVLDAKLFRDLMRFLARVLAIALHESPTRAEDARLKDRGESRHCSWQGADGRACATRHAELSRAGDGLFVIGYLSSTV